MAIDTPARIAIVGAGPVGLEAALYARFLGYDVDVYERGQTLENMRALGDATLPLPWGQSASPLGVAALKSQSADWQPAADDAQMPAVEMIERYYQPLAESDLVVDHVRPGTTVAAIAKDGLAKDELIGDEERGEHDFRLLVRGADGAEEWATADAVIDASGPGGDVSLYEELHVEIDADSGAPRLDGIRTTEPNFYVLGAKSFGRGQTFTIADGLRQIRELFALVGDRAELDLYRSIGQASG